MNRIATKDQPDPKNRNVCKREVMFRRGVVCCGSGSPCPTNDGQGWQSHVKFPHYQTFATALAGMLLVVTLFGQAAHAQQSQPEQNPPNQQQRQQKQPPAITADGVQKAPSENELGQDQLAPSEPVASQAIDPRDAYNNALAYLNTDFDRAEKMLTEARRDAATDGDVRFRATYNLGWVAVKRADTLISQKPQDALGHLRRAADWFRDAVRLRPDDTGARHNLEVVLRRILELADSLAQRDDRNLSVRLDELIKAQRELVSNARQLVDRVAAESDPNASERFRSDFRQLSVAQRTILSDNQSVSQTAQEELEALHAKTDKEKTAQDRVRAAQLTSLLQYTDRASQRLGQARSQMRQRQAERSFRRAAAGLTELKRARDQLRNPVEVLDVILADAMSLAQLTEAKAQAGRLFANAAVRPGVNDTDAQQTPTRSDTHEPPRVAKAPSWLTQEYLEDTQNSVTERTTELTSRFQSAVAQAASRVPPPPSSSSSSAPSSSSSASPSTSPSDSPEAKSDADQFLAQVRTALPFLETGQSAFQSASQSLAADRPDEAAAHQFAAISALSDARERFLDLRGLIEVAYASETEIQQLLPAAETQTESGKDPTRTQNSSQDQNSAASESQPPTENATPVDQTAEPEKGNAESVDDVIADLQLAATLQSGNLDRSERIRSEIETELAALPEPSAKGNDRAANPQSKDSPQQEAAKRQQLQLAQQLLGQARDEMTQVQHETKSSLDETTNPPDDSTSDSDKEKRGRLPYEARLHADRAVQSLEALRRLFFSIVEHLRETAQRQAELNDETEQVAASVKGGPSDGKLASQTQPLSFRQQELRSISEQIAQALKKQAEQQPTTGQQSVDPKQLEQFQQVAERFAKAGKLVTDGGQEMQQAAEQLSAASNEPGGSQQKPGDSKAPTQRLPRNHRTNPMKARTPKTTTPVRQTTLPADRKFSDRPATRIFRWGSPASIRTQHCKNWSKR